jgi:cytoskeletal protein RodZ
MAKRKTKTSDLPKSRPTESDDENFGLPEVEPTQLSEQAEPQAAVQELAEPEAAPEAIEPAPAEWEKPAAPVTSETAQPSSDFGRRTYYEQPAPPSRNLVPIIIGIIVIILGLGGAVYWFYVKPRQEKEKQELLAKQKKERDDANMREAIAEEERKRREAAEAEKLAELNKKPAVGTIDTLTDRTRRYYVVLSSAVDADLIMDYAKKLSAKGISTHVLPPFGNVKFTRLTMGDFDSYANAQAAADSAKAEHGSNLWVIRY